MIIEDMSQDPLSKSYLTTNENMSFTFRAKRKKRNPKLKIAHKHYCFRLKNIAYNVLKSFVDFQKQRKEISFMTKIYSEERLKRKVLGALRNQIVMKNTKHVV